MDREQLKKLNNMCNVAHELQLGTILNDVIETIETGGSGVAVQSDWLEDNDESMAYIKNKPEVVASETIGDLADLKTTKKDNIVNAINEIQENGTPIEIVDNLDSTDTDKALSANQGKILKDSLIGIKGRDTDYELVEGAEIFNDYRYNQAWGKYSHAEGSDTIAWAQGTHAEGLGTIATGKWQHVQGKYNTEDQVDIYAHIVGNGTSVAYRSNAHTIDWDGNAWFAGDIKIGGDEYQDDNAKTVVTTDIIGDLEGLKTSDHLSIVNAINEVEKGHEELFEEIADIKTDIKDKQNKLTFDNVPILSSSNPVTSNGIKNAIEEINTNLSAEIDKKANKATTLGGYEITDAYTKAEIDSKLAGAYRYIGTKTVAEVTAIDTKTLSAGDVYNISDSGILSGDIKVNKGDNIAWTGTEWDNLAGLIDLSNYQEKLFFDDSPSANSSNPVKSSGIYTELNNKVTKVSGKALSTNDYTNEDKTEVGKIKDKQDKLTFDSIPTADSDNPVKSSAIKTALDNLTTEINKKQTKQTTLTGYGITDAYTKGEVDTKLSIIGDTSILLTEDKATLVAIIQDLVSRVSALENK